MSLSLTHPTNYNVIVLKTNDLGGTHYHENTAGGAIKPGHLIQRGVSGVVVVHGVAGGPAEPLFAEELGFVADIPANAGSTVTVTGGTVNDAYASGDTVRAYLGGPGDEIWAWLPAGAAAVVENDYLTSNGDGTLKKAATTDVRIAKPLEPIDNSAGGAAVRIAVRLI